MSFRTKEFIEQVKATRYKTQQSTNRTRWRCQTFSLKEEKRYRLCDGATAEWFLLSISACNDRWCALNNRSSRRDSAVQGENASCAKKKKKEEKGNGGCRVETTYGDGKANMSLNESILFSFASSAVTNTHVGLKMYFIRVRCTRFTVATSRASDSK